MSGTVNFLHRAYFRLRFKSIYKHQICLCVHIGLWDIFLCSQTTELKYTEYVTNHSYISSKYQGIRHSVAGIVTAQRAGLFDFQFAARRKIDLVSRNPDQLWGHRSPLFNVCGSSAGTELPGREVDPTPPSRTKVENDRSSNSTPAIHLHALCCFSQAYRPALGSTQPQLRWVSGYFPLR